jgi:leader peptidase (prepilin peptidase)/N-methyltransferase
VWRWGWVSPSARVVGKEEAMLAMALLDMALPMAVLGMAGAIAGAGARGLLRRMRRGTRIPPPWCELGVAALWAATGAAWVVGVLPAMWLPTVLALGWLAVAASAVDLRHRRLPNALTVPALPAALLLLLPVGPAAVVRGAGGAAVALAVNLAVHLVDRRAVGAGDVKLAAPLGAVLAAVAWPALALAAVLAALFTACIAVGAAVGAAVRAAVGSATDRALGPARAGGLWRPAAARAGPVRGWGLAERTAPHGPSMLAATWLVTVGLLALGAGGDGPGG